MEELLRTVRFVITPEFWRMAVFWTLSLISSYCRLFFGALIGQKKSKSYSRSKSYFFTSATAGVQRPICIVTGATSGLGAAAAHALSREGFFVVLVGRSNHLLSKTVVEIVKGNENALVKAFEADLSSFSSILKFKVSFEQWLVDMDMDRSVQLLINNVGILATTYRSTADGLDDYELHRQFSSKEGTSHVSVIAADPGVVKTNIMREMPYCTSQLAYVVLKLLGLLRYPEDGVGSILDAALAPPGTSGVYFFGGKGNTISSSSLSYDSKLAGRLWKASTDLLLDLKLSFDKISSPTSDSLQ